MIFFILIVAVSVNSKFFLVHLIPHQKESNTYKGSGHNGAENLKVDDDDMYKAINDTEDQDYQGYDDYFGNHCSLWLLFCFVW